MDRQIRLPRVTAADGLFEPGLFDGGAQVAIILQLRSEGTTAEVPLTEAGAKDLLRVLLGWWGTSDVTWDND